MIERSVRKRDRCADEGVEVDWTLANILDVQARWLNGIHVLQIGGQITGAAPYVENTVARPDVVCEHFTLLLEPDLGPEHVRTLRDAVHSRQESRSDFAGYSLYGGQLVLHPVGEYGRRLSEPKQYVNSSFSKHIVVLPAFRAESLIVASLSSCTATMLTPWK